MANGSPLAYLDETGLHLPDYPTVLAFLQDKFRAIYGEDSYLEPDSQDGNLLSIFAKALSDAYDLSASVYNSYGPTTAQGVSLERQVAINGLKKGKATHSTVSLRLVGTVGTVLKDAQAKDSADQVWVIPTTTIPVTGEITVTATAEKAGAVQASAGDITKMATPLLGWHAVINPTAAAVGAAVEKDAALRTRQRVSTALPSRTVFEGIIGAVANLTGVTRMRGYENDTNATDVNGIPAKSICVVVEGGNNTEIAEAIAIKKTPGGGTYGDVTVWRTDRYGSPVAINFFRRTQVEITVKITLQARRGYVSTTGATINKDVAAAIDKLGIGEAVLISKLYTPINAAEPSAALRSFDVLSVEMGIGTGPLGPGNISIAFNEAASAASVNVDVIVS